MLEAIPWSTIGPAGLLALTVLLIIRGDLIPRKQYEAMTTDRDFWRANSEKKDAVIADFVEVARTTGMVIEKLPAAAAKATEKAHEEGAEQ